MDNPKKCILIVEDDRHIAEGLELNLTLQGYDVVVAEDGPAGLESWKQIGPDLVVLDIMLPTIDGLAVLKAIRQEDERLPVLVLSAKSESEDKIKGLTYGVDDYLSKPFNLEEFLLRVDRLLKRAEWSRSDSAVPSDAGARFTFGQNTIDFDSGRAICREGNIVLTDQELKLLKLFVANRGKPLSRQRLLEIGWGYKGRISTRTVDNFMVRLRKYFEINPKKPRHFISQRSVGYIFNPDP